VKVTSPDLVAGDRVRDRYVVRELIGSGAMGAVYKADDSDGGSVALKHLVDTSQSARFEIEARLLTRLNHPRVVSVLDHFEEGQNKFLVMKLVEGTNLGAVLRAQGDPGLPIKEAVKYAQHVCEALQYVHEQDIVHRDVKPQNLVLGADGVVLVDFGIARRVDTETSVTRVAGTPQYMAPEILVGEFPSPRSDVYSLGATLWALLTGKPPSYNEPSGLSERVRGVTLQLEQILREALDLRPERRLASVAAFARGLGAPPTPSRGRSLAMSVEGPAARQRLLEAITRTAAGVFDAAAASIALIDPVTGELIFEAAWGAGAEDIVGVRLAAGAGIAGSVAASGEGIAVPNCRDDPHFSFQIAAGTGYLPHTMLALPLQGEREVVGVLSVLDRRDGQPYSPLDLGRASLFSDLVVAALPAAHA
jgi:hypothetical protein